MYIECSGVLKKVAVKVAHRKRKASMINSVKENDDISGDNSKNKKFSYSNGSKTDQSGRRRKYLESGEEDSRYIMLNNPKINKRNSNQLANMAKHKEINVSIVSPIFQPQHKNQKHERGLIPTFPGMKFTGVIDGIIPGGHLLTIRVGNDHSFQGKTFFSSRIRAQIEEGSSVNVPWASPTNNNFTQMNHNQSLNQEKEKDHLKNILNQESCRSFGINKNSFEFEIDDELHSDYSYIEMPPSPEPHVSDPLLVTNKFVPVVLTQVNPLTRVPIDQTKSPDKGKNGTKDYHTPNPKNYRIGIDPFLSRKFPSPAISISPPCDGVRRKKNL
ncbi:hypothetical protein RYX36_005649 [Vicia faba]